MVDTALVGQLMRDNALRYEAFGRTDTLRNFAASFGINLQTLRHRLHAGLAIEEALTRPIYAVMGPPPGRSKLSRKRRGPARGGARKISSNWSFSE